MEKWTIEIDVVDFFYLLKIAKFSLAMLNQWEFQEPKMEVPTIYKAYVRPM